MPSFKGKLFFLDNYIEIAGDLLDIVSSEVYQ